MIRPARRVRMAGMKARVTCTGASRLRLICPSMSASENSSVAPMMPPPALLTRTSTGRRASARWTTGAMSPFTVTSSRSTTSWSP